MVAPKPSPKPSTMVIGNLGEQLVAQWLVGQQWQILARQWRSRWGELDLIALEPPGTVLAFVEVKTRAGGNWDADGLLAVTPQKQARLWQTAELFLAAEPQYAPRPCRFDLALVTYRHARSGGTRRDRPTSPAQALPAVTLGEPLLWQGYELTLAHYLPAAFSQ